MNIKSLLIGSAVATVAVSGAQAADVIIAPEPEPMEYVRVCDVYGAGFFYIPGTETCLKIGGYVRYQIDWAEDDEGWRKLARGTLTVDARSETELGTLGGFIEWRSQTQSGINGIYDGDGDGDAGPGSPDNYVRLQQAIISLGGLSMGLSDTLYDAGLSGEFDKGGGDRVHFMRYTFDAANGVFVSIALEEADYNYDYTPNVVGNLGVAQGWGSFNLWGAYDATAEEWAAKAIASINATEALELQLLGIYESGESFYSAGMSNVTDFDGDGDLDGLGGYEWSAGGYLKYTATPKLTLGFGGQYFSENHLVGGNDYTLGAVVDYALVKDFNTKIAINYRDGDNFSDGDNNNWEGFVRFDRKF